eukprot:6185504-Pleurochrysis_carterae.AAC.2
MAHLSDGDWAVRREADNGQQRTPRSAHDVLGRLGGQQRFVAHAIDHVLLAQRRVRVVVDEHILVAVVDVDDRQDLHAELLEDAVAVVAVDDHASAAARHDGRDGGVAALRAQIVAESVRLVASYLLVLRSMQRRLSAINCGGYVGKSKVRREKVEFGIILVMRRT